MIITTRQRLFDELFDNYGQGDTERTNRIIDKTMTVLYPMIAHEMVNEFAEWVADFGDSPAGQRNVTMNEIITRAKWALGLSSDYQMNGQDSVRFRTVADVLPEAAWDTIRTYGADEPAHFAFTVLILDDPDTDSLGGRTRRETNLSTIIYWAKIALNL